MAAKIISLFLIGGLNISIGLLVLVRDVKKMANLAFFGMSLFTGLWSIGIGAFLISQDSVEALAWAKFYYICALLLSYCLAQLAYTFPSTTMSLRRLTVTTIPALVLVLLISTIPDFLTSKAVINVSTGNNIVLNKLHYLIYSICLGVYFYVGLSLLWKKSKSKLGIVKKQSSLLFIACAAASFFGITYNLILPWLGNYSLIWVGPLMTGIFICIVAVSIVRHRMFDIRAVVARTLGYSVSLFALAVVYGALVFGVFSLLLGQSFSLRFQIIISTTTAITGLAFPYIKKFFDRQTNRLFYRDAYDSQKLLAEINSIVISNVDVEALLKNTREIIIEHFKVQMCGVDLSPTVAMARRQIGLDLSGGELNTLANIEKAMSEKGMDIVITDEVVDEDTKLHRDLSAINIGVAARLSVTSSGKSEQYGMLVFGLKKSGSPYNSKDAEMIRIISSELAIAIQNALQYEEIEQFNETLQHKVEDATRKLRKTNDKLRSLDETKDEFISMASHQLRTPLTAVKGYVSMVLDGDAGELTPGQRKMLGQAFVSSQRMSSLISDLLNVSRLRTGKFIIETSRVNLVEVIEGEIAQLKETAAGRGLLLTFDKPAHFPVCMLDETKTRQVVMNFMDNAVYYTRPGGKITVQLAEKQDSIEFTVTDNGIGVPASEQPHLFTKFYRADNARKARPDGTGLGLFMAKKVVVAQGGAIIFKSVEGHGSIFGFTFPKAKIIQQ